MSSSKGNSQYANQNGIQYGPEANIMPDVYASEMYGNGAPFFTEPDTSSFNPNNPGPINSSDLGSHAGGGGKDSHGNGSKSGRKDNNQPPSLGSPSPTDPNLSGPNLTNPFGYGGRGVSVSPGAAMQDSTGGGGGDPASAWLGPAPQYSGEQGAGGGSGVSVAGYTDARATTAPGSWQFGYNSAGEPVIPGDPNNNLHEFSGAGKDALATAMGLPQSDPKVTDAYNSFLSELQRTRMASQLGLDPATASWDQVETAHQTANTANQTAQATMLSDPNSIMSPQARAWFASHPQAMAMATGQPVPQQDTSNFDPYAGTQYAGTNGVTSPWLDNSPSPSPTYSTQPPAPASDPWGVTNQPQQPGTRTLGARGVAPPQQQATTVLPQGVQIVSPQADKGQGGGGKGGGGGAGKGGDGGNGSGGGNGGGGNTPKPPVPKPPAPVPPPAPRPGTPTYGPRPAGPATPQDPRWTTGGPPASPNPVPRNTPVPVGPPPPPIVVGPRPVGPNVGPQPGDPGYRPSPAVSDRWDDYLWGSGGASGNRDASGAGAFYGYRDLADNPDVPADIRNEMLISGEKQARAQYAGAEDLNARQGAATGATAGIGAANAMLARNEAGTINDNTRATNIALEQERERRLESGLSGLSSMYNTETGYMGNLIGGRAAAAYKPRITTGQGASQGSGGSIDFGSILSAL